VRKMPTRASAHSKPAFRFAPGVAAQWPCARATRWSPPPPPSSGHVTLVKVVEMSLPPPATWGLSARCVRHQGEKRYVQSEEHLASPMPEGNASR